MPRDVTLSYALAHAFATGPTGTDHGPVHVGLLPLREGADVQAWRADPGRRVLRRLYYASGLSNDDVAEAPAWDAVRGEVRDALADYDVVFTFGEAHERSWIEALAAEAGGPRCVDLTPLVAFFLPHRDFLDRKALCEEVTAGYRRSAPQLPFWLQAMRHVLGEILRVVLTPAPDLGDAHPVFAFLSRCAAAGVPHAFGALEQCARDAHAHFGEGLYRLPAPRSPDLFPLDPTTLQNHLETLLPAQPDRLPYRGSGAPRKTVDPDFVEGAFAALRQRERGDLTRRPAQERYALFCAEGFNQGGLFAAEAGTGTGKTFGYLIPACEYVRRNPGRTVIVATATKTLQDQVIREELPRLTFRGSLHQDVSGALLKGRGNYLCAGALASQHQALFVRGAASEEDEGTALLSWLYLYLRLRLTGGAVDDIPAVLSEMLPPLRPLWREVTADQACTPGVCPYGLGCVYGRHLGQALAADIVVVNHFKMASLPLALTEQADVCLIDEADRFPDNLRKALRDEVTPWRLRRDLLRRLFSKKDRRRKPKRRGYLEVLRDRLEREQEGATGPEGAVREEMLSEIGRAETACQATHRRLEAIGRLIPEDTREERWQRLARRRSGPGAPPLDAALQEALVALTSDLGRLARALRRLTGSTRYESKEHKKHQTEKQRLERYHDLAHEWQQTARAVTQDYPARAWVHTVAHERYGWVAARTPFDLGPALQTLVRESFRATVLTSATLYVDDALDFYRHVLDLNEPFDGALRERSPFDYAGRVYGAVTTFVPPYDYRAPRARKAERRRAMVRTLEALLRATQGRSLVLFTSWRELKATYEALAPRLEAHDIEVLCQQGASRAELLRFREVEHTVLLGVDRFWSGVDVPGRALSQVVVARLPNPSLGDPLIEHRREHEGEAFWEQYYRPASRLRLRQGFGRLIRRETDRGLFVVLDGRLATQGHLRHLAGELPIPLVEVPARDDPDAPIDLRRMLHAALGRVRLRTERAAQDETLLDDTA